MKYQTPKKHRWLLWRTLILIPFFLFSPFLLYRLRNHAVFENKVKELAVAGYPVSLDDLESQHVLPEGVENAADMYIKAHSMYVEPNEIEEQLLPMTGNYVLPDDLMSYPDEVIDAIADNLERNKQCLELLDQAVKIEHCSFPIIRAGECFFYSELPSLRRFVYLLAEQNIYLAQAGQQDALFDILPKFIRLSESTSIPLSDIGYLLMMAVNRTLIESVEDSLNLTCFSDIQLSELQETFRNMRQKEPSFYINSQISQRVQIIGYNNLPMSDMKDLYRGCSWNEDLLFVFYWASGLLEKDFIFMLDSYDRLIEIAKLPFEDQFVEYNVLESETQLQHQRMNGFSLVVSCDIEKKIRLRFIAKTQCAETVMAIERYRLKYNMLPESLSALEPEFIDTVFIDPYDGNELRYIQHESGGYTVYSIGFDGIDNGGLNKYQMENKMGTWSSSEYGVSFTIKH